MSAMPAAWRGSCFAFLLKKYQNCFYWMESTQAPFFFSLPQQTDHSQRYLVFSQENDGDSAASQSAFRLWIRFVVFATVWAQTPEAPPTDVTQMSTSELEKQASLLVGTQKYVEAVPLLSELLTRLSETKEPQLQAKVENFRYFLGLGHVFNNDWEGAAATFEAFLKSHPKSNRYRRVLELYGDTLVQSKQYAEAAEQYKKLLEMKLPDTEDVPDH